jgi:hypothetical protein
LFLKWSHDYLLLIDDVKLRNKNWVEMLPKGLGDEDVDAIESEFFTFKGKAKTRQYMPNKVLELYLGISHAKRTEIDNHIEEFKSKLSNTLEITTNSVSVSYQVFTCLCPSELS